MHHRYKRQREGSEDGSVLPSPPACAAYNQTHTHMRQSPRNCQSAPPDDTVGFAGEVQIKPTYSLVISSQNQVITCTNSLESATHTHTQLSPTSRMNVNTRDPLDSSLQLLDQLLPCQIKHLHHCLCLWGVELVQEREREGFGLLPQRREVWWGGT